MKYDDNEKKEWESRIKNNNRYKSVGKQSLPDVLNRYRKEALFNVLDRVLDMRITGIEDTLVLDIGCGTGIYSEYYYDKGAEIFGSDISKSAVQTSREFVPSGVFLQAEASQQPFTNNTFDITHIFSVLYHIVDDTKWKHALRELVRVTRPGGYLFMRIEWVDLSERRAEHVKYRSKEEYLDILAGDLGCQISGVYDFSDVVRFREFFIGLNRLGPEFVSKQISTIIPSKRILKTNKQQKVVIIKLPKNTG